MFGACYYPWYRSYPIKFDISLDYDESVLTKVTANNLNKLAFELNIKWHKILAKQIIQAANPYYRRGARRAWSILIIGTQPDGTIWQYWRKETAGPAAGQTLLYKHFRHPMQATSVLAGKRHPKW